MAELLGGVVHDLPADLRAAITAEDVGDLWNGLTPLGRNEFVCWVENAKRRPCCRPGCDHRERTGKP